MIAWVDKTDRDSYWTTMLGGKFYPHPMHHALPLLVSGKISQKLPSLSLTNKVAFSALYRLFKEKNPAYLDVGHCYSRHAQTVSAG